MKIFCIVGITFVLLVGIIGARASSVIPLSVREHIRVSDVVFRGKVVAMSCYEDGSGIFTRTSLRVDEPLKGKFPAVILLVHRGGQVGHESEYCGFSPTFKMGGEYLAFAMRGRDGRLVCTEGAASAMPLLRVAGANFDPASEKLLEEVRALTRNGKIPGADVTDQVGENGGATALVLTGMLGGTASRFLAPDRGEPIPYLIDADTLPAGITLAQATNAVLQALNAWAAVTSLKFQFEAFQSFGTNAQAAGASAKDEKLRIQLHDNYHFIPGGTDVLGIGGRGGINSPVNGVGWDLGGNVAGNEFQKTTFGFVVLNSTDPSMQNLSTFTEVLGHEIGHALNLAHSSENPNETDPILLNSIMYYAVHSPATGATLNSYDTQTVQQIFPVNTPPYSYGRVLDVTTAPSTPSVAGINEVEMRGYDLQTTNLTLLTTNSTTFNGAFSVAGNKIQYTPAGFYGSNGRLDPAGSIYNDTIYVRFSDGTNASPYVRVRVLSYNPDTDAVSDGIPDSWMTAYFNHAAPQAGDKSQATDDADGDGLNNLQEYLAGMNPTNAVSAQKITALAGGGLQWQAKAYELYEVLESTNLTNWFRVGNPVLPTNATLLVRTSLPPVSITATISNLPTTNAHMYFRVQKVP